MQERKKRTTEAWRARRENAPIPERVVVEGEALPLATRDGIMAGHDVFQRYGLMDFGSTWGHGTLRGMDFSADTLHRMGRLAHWRIVPDTMLIVFGALPLVLFLLKTFPRLRKQNVAARQ